MKSVIISINTTLNNAFFEVERALKKHGLQPDLGIPKQWLVVSEEYGEIAMDINKALLTSESDIPDISKLKDAKIEIIQTIAMLCKLGWYIDLELDNHE